MLFAFVALSWAVLLGFRPPVDGPVRTLVDLLEALTRPVLQPLRSMMPPVRVGGVGLDLSVVAAFVVLWIAQAALGC